MIEQQTFKGRAATVAYLSADFEPADKTSFDLAKIIFDDGETIWLAADQTPRRVRARARARALAKLKLRFAASLAKLKLRRSKGRR